MNDEEQSIKNNPFLQFLVASRWRWGRHFLFLAVVALTAWNAGPHYSAPWDLYEKIMGVSVFLLVFYINLYWLVPQLLFRDRYAAYAVSVLVLAIVVDGLSVAKHHWLDGYLRPPYLHEAILQHPGSDQLAVIIFFITLLAPSTAIRLFQRSIIYHQRIAELEKISMQSELEQLKNQINPHFLFNMLNNVNVLTQQDPEKASQVLMKLSDLLRYQLYDSSRGKVLLTADIHFLTDFLNLEKIRRDNFEFIISREGALNNVLIPPHLFITFVENAVKHNMDPEKASYVQVYFSMQEQELHFKCINSKPGQPATPQRAGGLGLANVRRTLDLLYPGKYNLDICNDPATYTVNLSIQL